MKYFFLLCWTQRMSWEPEESANKGLQKANLGSGTGRLEHERAAAHESQ